ncbi:MAG: succinate dehydrogenase, cytochrome b556 subunit [Acidiferrobacterales bacterium]|nr:succinate dehydrogenase, cytochrome b556 subunit [Acidiferrobacterales bacterium]
MNPSNRPVSPHIQIYRPQLTSVMSILHRITGVVLAFGAVLIALWLSAIAYNPDLSNRIFEFLSGVTGRLFLFIWTLNLFYHLCNGIRHLFWDSGKGFEITQVYRSGWVAITCSFILTIVVWTVGYTACG